MSAVRLTIAASLMFAAMGVCIKFASQHHGSGEIVFYRGVVGALMIAALGRWRGESMRTGLGWQHAQRSVVGVVALILWFQAIAALPLATAVTLNYTSTLWLAVILVGAALRAPSRRVDRRSLWAVTIGFIGIVLVLRPTIESHLVWYGVLGLISGLLAAIGYQQVATLSRAGEPETRIVFYFSLGSVAGGAAMVAIEGWRAPAWPGLGWMLAVGALSTVAQLMLTRAYASGATLLTASLQYAGIAFSFLFGVLLFDDAITVLAVVGVLLIVGAGILATHIRRVPESKCTATRVRA